MENISLKIKHVMLDRNMTQNDIAVKLNTTRQNISRILSNNDMKISVLTEIADTLDCDVHIDIMPRSKGNL